MTSTANGRDPATGRFLQGNKNGGRKAVPDFVKADGDAAFRVLLEVMKGEREDRRVSAAQAAETIVAYVFGKPTQIVADENSGELLPAVAAILERALAARLATLSTPEEAVAYAQHAAEVMAAGAKSGGAAMTLALTVMTEEPKGGGR